jgi:4-hydroxy-3-methylbut-2-enyl diphosphate reductase
MSADITPPETYFRRGLGLGADVRSELDADYSAGVVDRMRASDNTLQVGEVTIRLAQEFGFCYGVERAVDYAYQTRRKFPDRRLRLLGEIIHNPHVNANLSSMGIEIMEPRESAVDGEPRFDYADVRSDHVVILPAFGVTMADFQALRGIGCVIVDTTCGSVLNVWKRVESYARDGLTSLIHGKYYHEETRATASQVLKYDGGSYLVVRDMDDAECVCTYIARLGSPASDDADQAKAAFRERFAASMSPGFDPDIHLRRIGVANQTTMLARESLAIGARVGVAMASAFGDAWKSDNFRTFDTICSATQDRQDAVAELLNEPLDAMIVVGGYNSSNTISLAALCAERVTTFHIADAASIDPHAGTVHFRPAGLHHREEVAQNWLRPAGSILVGITAGASTPNNKISETVARILATRGLSPPTD